MKELREAHRYELDSFEGSKPQVLQFIEKEVDGEGNLVTILDGTTNEEVLEVLINRLTKLNDKFPSSYNERALNHMKGALAQLHARTAERSKRGVEEKHKK